MDAATTALAFRCSKARAAAAVDGINLAMIQADCRTVRRCAMFVAQVGHETLGLYYDGEVWGPTDQQLKYDPASGSKLSRDLGNTARGDGYRYRGRGRIQLTGKINYARFSQWCHARGLVPTDDHFVRNPDLVAAAPWRELAAAWYWTVARKTINAESDAGDIVEVTRLINGGANGLADRKDRYAGALRLGDALLPTGAPSSAPAPERDWFDMATEADLRRVVESVVGGRLEVLVRQMVYGDGDPAHPETWGWPGFKGGTGEHHTVVDMIRRLNVEVRSGRSENGQRYDATAAELRALRSGGVAINPSAAPAAGTFEIVGTLRPTGQ